MIVPIMEWLRIHLFIRTLGCLQSPCHQEEDTHISWSPSRVSERLSLGSTLSQLAHAFCNVHVSTFRMITLNWSCVCSECFFFFFFYHGSPQICYLYLFSFTFFFSFFVMRGMKKWKWKTRLEKSMISPFFFSYVFFVEFLFAIMMLVSHTGSLGFHLCTEITYTDHG